VLEAEDPVLAKAMALAAVPAVLLLAGGLVLRLAWPVPVAVALFVAAYTGLMADQVKGVDTRAPVVAAVLLAIAELAYWSGELRGAVSDEAGTYLRRCALLALLLVGVVATGTIMLVLAEAVRTGGIEIEAIGAAAAIGAVALVALAARRSST